MGYNTKNLLVDAGNKPIPQYYDEVNDQLFPLGHIYDSTLQNNASAIGNGTPLSVGNIKTLTIEVSGTSSSQTVVFEGASVSGTYYAIQGTKLNDLSVGSQTTSLGELWMFDVTGLVNFRARISAITGGNVSVKGKGVSV